MRFIAIYNIMQHLSGHSDICMVQNLYGIESAVTVAPALIAL
jgi:hypothetical protein